MTLHNASLGLSVLCCLSALPVSASAVVFVSDQVNTRPTPDDFSLCYDNSCHTVLQTALSTAQWRQVHELFRVQVRSAQEERQSIARAIALLEHWTGLAAGTSSDRGENRAPGDSSGHRMDCIDESTNTTTYLYMLQQDNLLQWHRVDEPVTRGFFIFGWPHTTAVIRSLDGKQQWAVDAWFHDNGTAPEIVPLEQWRDGWRPGTP